MYNVLMNENAVESTVAKRQKEDGVVDVTSSDELGEKELEQDDRATLQGETETKGMKEDEKARLQEDENHLSGETGGDSCQTTKMQAGANLEHATTHPVQKSDKKRSSISIPFLQPISSMEELQAIFDKVRGSACTRAIADNQGE